MRLAHALAASALAVAALASASLAQSRVTIFARPTVVGWTEYAQLFGAAPGATHQDIVRVEVRECGSNFFQTYVELHPSSGGGWSTPAGSAITATYRAVWRGRMSARVTIRQRANVALERRRSGGGFIVAVSAKRSFWRKHVVVQRRTRGGWETVRRLVLSDSVESTGTVSASQATFRLAVPRGTTLRALLPAAEAGPCYVESVSKTVRA
jgi:hypothetical protein